MFRFVFVITLTYSVLVAYLVSSECMFDSESENQYKSYLSDLQEYTKNNPIKITDVNYTYTIGICTPVKDENIGVTQEDAEHGKHNLGFINKAHVQAGSYWILLEYHGGDPYNSHCDKESRQTHIMIMCDEDNNMVGSTVILEENNLKSKDCYYLFEITSSVACSLPNHKSKKSGLSLGSILSILCIVIAFLYMVGGFVYQRFVTGAKGSEQFPNLAFWRDFGNLVADGCDLVFRSNPSSDSPVYRGLGDDELGPATVDEDDDDDVQPLY